MIYLEIINILIKEPDSEGEGFFQLMPVLDKMLSWKNIWNLVGVYVQYLPKITQVKTIPWKFYF